MMNDDRFLPSGYVNMAPLLTGSAPFVFAIGGRGTGKTYGTAAWLRQNASGRFAWIRRRDNEISTMKAGAPFGNVPGYEGCVWKGSKEATYIREDSGDLVCPVLPWATSGNVTGLDLSYLDYLVFDEFIPKKGAVAFKDEFDIWSALQETVGRNRELEGRPPLKTVHISNSDSLNSELLIRLELVPVIVRMRAEGVRIWTSPDGLVEIRDYSDSDISQAKRETSLYRLIAGSQYAKMALDNEYAFDDFSDVRRRPVREYKPLFTVGGMVTLYIHKHRDELYASRHRSGDVPDFTPDAQGRKELLRLFPYIHEAVAEGVTYESIECKYLLTKIL